MYVQTKPGFGFDPLGKLDPDANILDNKSGSDLNTRIRNPEFHSFLEKKTF